MISKFKMQLISKLRKDLDFIKFNYICSKYAWVVLLKNKKGTTITNAFQEN